MESLIRISALVFLLCISHTVSQVLIRCSKNNLSDYIDQSKEVCVGLYGKKAANASPLYVDWGIGTDCNAIISDSKRTCAEGWYVSCCNNSAHCLDSMDNSTFVACESTTRIACSATSTGVITKGTSVCFRTFDGNTSSSSPVSTNGPYETSCTGLEKSLTVSKCPNGKFFVCCEGKLCLDEPTAKPEHAMACEEATKFTCSSEFPSEIMLNTETVCVGFHGETAAYNKPLKVSTEPRADCDTIKNTEKSECPAGWFVSCCSGSNCLDKLSSATEFLACESKTKFLCSATSTEVFTSGSSVCFRTFDHKKLSSSVSTSVENKTSCDELKKSLNVSKCPDGKLFVCCEGEHCLDEPAAKAEHATECEAATIVTCSVTSPSITMQAGETVCAGIYGKTAAGDKKLMTFSPEDKKECKTRKANCPSGWFVSCCSGLNCLDNLPTTEFEACESTTETACSSTSSKVMTKGSSVCFKVFSDKNGGSTGTASVQPYESCEKAKAQVKTICPGKYYTCCEKANCLDNAKAADSEECGDATGGSGGIKCLSSDPTLVATKDKSVCLAILKLGTKYLKPMVVQKADCDAAKKAVCSRGSLVYCCIEDNCLNDTKDKIVTCPLSRAAFKSTTNQFLPLCFLFLFYLFI